MSIEEEILPLNDSEKTVRVAKWYFGGVAGSLAACHTHPLDLLKVRVDTTILIMVIIISIDTVILNRVK